MDFPAPFVGRDLFDVEINAAVLHLRELERMNYLVGVAFAVSRVVAVDPLLQNGRRLEHDHATRRDRHLGAGLRVTADTLTFLEIFRHGSVSLSRQNPRPQGDAHRGI